MKKRFFLSLIAAIVLTFSASAQNSNTYSMVLTLANGTTVTIGPNELQNISFNNGEVNFSGQSIESLVESVNANKANIEKHSVQIERQDSKIEDLQKKIVAISENLLTLDDVKKLLADEGFASAASVKDLESQIAALNAQITDLANQNEALNAQVANTNYLENYLEKRISALEEVVANLSSGGE